MRYALINPPWSFRDSIYFGCKQPHLPLEYGYSKAILEEAGHSVLIIDAQLEQLSLDDIVLRLADFKPDFSVVTTAPSYLFWRCALPELRVPQETVLAIRDFAGTLVVVGPHASTTPIATVKKLGADVAVLGECEEILPLLAGGNWERIDSICYADSGGIHRQGSPHASDMTAVPALTWPARLIEHHHHHHHRFDAEPAGYGAEVEFSRGCPYRCSFCAKDNFRDSYRKRPLATVLREIDALLEQGVEYIYFVDETFVPNRPLLTQLRDRKVKFGIQTRIDLWKPDMLDLLGAAGCVSIEAGIESITERGRDALVKDCRMSSDQLAERLIYAKLHVPFVQANLPECQADDPVEIEAWREHVIASGVWANKPVPLFPYPGSPEYTRKWGLPDESAWERAVDYYLQTFSEFSDIQEARPARLEDLEIDCTSRQI
jgi:B12-binding domain/radical SAM domain protein of rhizo-twelve system